MQGKNKLFGASFEQSKRIIKKDILTEEGAQIGSFSSMSFWKRASLLVFLVAGFITYGVGIHWPDSLRSAPESVQVISESTGALIGEIGFYLRTPILVTILIYTALVLINLLPKINYAHQLLYGTIFITSFVFVIAVATLPVSIGLTIGAFGWIVFFFQLVICVPLFNKFVVSKITYLKDCLYGRKKAKVDEWSLRISRFIKKYGGILIGLSILNRWTFKIGENVNDNPELLFILSGCLFLFFAAIMLLSLGILIVISVKTFYFFKYRKEYREYFNITNEQWYGKFRARFMSK
jgi:putative membrane protein